MKKTKKSPFRQGQVVCIRGLEMPFGAAVIAKVLNDAECETLETAEGHLIPVRFERYLRELRSLNKKERG